MNRAIQVKVTILSQDKINIDTADEHEFIGFIVAVKQCAWV